MLKFKLLSLCVLIATALGLKAQVVTYEPDPLYDNSENVVIYFHADQGNKGLANQAESVKIYAHTGLITSSSKDDSDWKYASEWKDNAAKYELTYVSPNLYKLEIGNIKTYYGVKSTSEVIKKLVFVFRNAAGTKEGKGVNGADITVPVISTALQLEFTSDAPSTTISADNATVNFDFKSNQVADRMWIAVNGVPIAEGNNISALKASYTFTEPGSYNVYGNVTINGKNSSKGFKMTYVNASEKRDYPGGKPKMGAVRQANGDVLFCLAAPQKLSCQLIGSWNDYASEPNQKMYYQDYDGQRYFWTSVSGLDNTTMYFYYYNVDEGTKVGDPYAKLVLDPANDKYIPASVYPNLPEYPSTKVTGNVPLAVYQENLNDYAWTDKDFKPVSKKDLVIYELLFRDFTGTEGKAQGNGTVKKALEKLPYLKELGVNAIELLPINEFNGNISWGYNPNFYFAPDKAYGTPDDYKEFINTCHENGIAVILDMVFNQTDWLHPWYRMYPVGSNPMYNADAPHAYSVLNDVNQGHPLIRQQWKDVVKYWMEEYHVDGYRFDLVKGLGDNNSYPNAGDSGTNAYNASRVANMHAIQEAMNEINPDAFFINENLAGAKEENEMAAYGMLNWANINTEGCQYAMGFSSNSGLQRMWAVKDARTAYSTVAYLESHDEERLAYKQLKFGNSAIKNNHEAACRRLGSAAAQMILVPGAHMIWMFSEMGNAQTTKNSDGGNNVDPKIVNWALLDDPDNYGLYRNYCELIDIRTANPELFGDNASYTAAVSASDWAKGRTILTNAGGKELICAINPGMSAPLTINVPFSSTKQGDYRIASKSYATEPVFDVTAGTVTVPANSYVVLVNNKVLDVEGIEAAADHLSVYGGEGVLNVANAPAGVEVYSLDGMLRYASSASEARIELPAGLYIVRSGSEALKTVIR
ncbi:MAG: hypothetical protein K2M31_03655 [Muribaculaceae bacterium]|nr:hypothetical protein [Muribaculaceae bacterium]